MHEEPPKPLPQPKGSGTSGEWGVAALLRHAVHGQAGQTASSGFATPKTALPDQAAGFRVPYPSASDPRAAAHRGLGQDSSGTKVSGPMSAANAAMSFMNSTLARSPAPEEPTPPTDGTP